MTRRLTAAALKLLARTIATLLLPQLHLRHGIALIMAHSVGSPLDGLVAPEAHTHLMQLLERRIALQRSALDDLGVGAEQYDMQVRFGG